MMRYAQLMYLFCISFLTSSCYSPTSANESCIKKAKSDLRVVTYNINWGGNRFSTTAPKKSLKVLRQIDADIVLLQEMTPFWFNALKSHLSSVYPYMEFKNDDHAGGIAYISKYPVRRIQYLRPSVKKEWHLGVIMDVDSPTGPLQVLNLHLTPPLISKNNASFSIIPFFSTCRIREKEIRFFYDHMQKNLPTIIVGDFNESDNGFVRYFLRQHGFRDAPSPFQYSWEWKIGAFKMKRKLDHVFYNPYFKLDHVQIIHDGDSDHFPIVVDLRKI